MAEDSLSIGQRSKCVWCPQTEIECHIMMYMDQEKTGHGYAAKSYITILPNYGFCLQEVRSQQLSYPISFAITQ